MQRYLNQLLADIELATRSVPDIISNRVYHSSHDDESPVISSFQFVRLSDLFGLNRYAFPPSDRLNKQQLATLLTAIENLWSAWNIRWRCPPKLTARPRYSFMVEKMTSEKIHYQYDFGAEIDFCDNHEAGKCPFGDTGTCYCKEEEANVLTVSEWWEQSRFDRFLDSNIPHTESPTEALNRWLHGDEYFDEPWMINEEKERWNQFIAEEDLLAWLYFYQPHHPEISNPDDCLSTDDFDDYGDFDWDGDEDDNILSY